MTRSTVPSRSVAGTLAGLAVVALAVTALVPGGVAAAAPPATGAPSLRAKPADLMVNTTTTVRGRGFAPGTAVRLVECSATVWPVLTNPCTTDNVVTVSADRKGSFTTGFRVELCPGGAHGRQPTSEICYLGVARPSGIDTEVLSPDVRITVTYP